MKIGNLLVNAAYLGDKVLTAIAVGATKVWEGVSKYIKFKDPVVEQLCMKWSSDGIGLTPEDAAKVTDIGTTFQGNTEITSFDELDRFGVKEIRSLAFENCENLVSINLSKIKRFSGWKAFMGCTNLVHLGNMDNVREIPESTFRGLVNLGGVINLPKLEILGHTNFNDSLIEEIANLGKIDYIYSTFHNCIHLRKVVLPNNPLSINSSFKNCTALTEIEINRNPNITEVSNYSFTGCPLQDMDELYLPNVHTYSPDFSGVRIRRVNLSDAPITKLTALGSYHSFGNRAYTEEVILPDCCTTFTHYPFAYYTGLQYVHLPEALTNIPYHCFNQCGLPSIEIPPNVNSIASASFGSCNKMIYMDLRRVLTVPTLENVNAFSRNTCQFIVPDNLYDQWVVATNWSTYADRIVKASEFVEPTTE